MSAQLPLFDEPKSKRGGHNPHGPRGLLLTLLRQGLDPSCVEAAARLVLLLDAEAVGEAE